MQRESVLNLRRFSYNKEYPMEKYILNNIHQLYRSHIVTLILFLLLGCLALFVVVGVVKFNLVKPMAWKIVLITATIVAVGAILFIQINSLIPVYKDYKESSYVVIEDINLTIKTGASGVIDKINMVVVDDGSGKTFELKMQSDLSLSWGCTYTGTIAYTINSSYVVWYSLD